MPNGGYDPGQLRDARKTRARANQMQRAICAIDLAVDSLSVNDRLIVLNNALRNALDDQASGGAALARSNSFAARSG
jgi:hypothetical protein